MSRWMLTIPRSEATKRKVFAFMRCNDVHKYTIGREQGRNGYQHWQIRFEASGIAEESDGFNIIKDWFPSAHIEAGASDNYEYERKDGRYFDSEDNYQILRRRYGNLRTEQQLLYNLAMESNDRQIIVWVDYEGNIGKSFFGSALWERRIAHHILPNNTAKGLIQDVASECIENGKRPIIVIDIPRTWKWTDELYFAIEKIKDGLIKDTRYHSRTIDIVGTAVIVLCNSYPKVGKLSADRWVIYESSRP